MWSGFVTVRRLFHISTWTSPPVYSSNQRPIIPRSPVLSFLVLVRTLDRHVAATIHTVSLVLRTTPVTGFSRKKCGGQSALPWNFGRRCGGFHHASGIPIGRESFRHREGTMWFSAPWWWPTGTGGEVGSATWGSGTRCRRSHLSTCNGPEAGLGLTTATGSNT